jgi:hypothetical protein
LRMLRCRSVELAATWKGEVKMGCRRTAPATKVSAITSW